MEGARVPESQAEGCFVEYLHCSGSRDCGLSQKKSIYSNVH